MRRIMLLGCATAAVLALSSTALATTSAQLKLSTNKAGAPVKLTFAYQNHPSEDPVTAPFQSHFVLWFPKGAAANLNAFPKCKVSSAPFRIPPDCRKAAIGKGAIHSNARVNDITDVLGALQAFNGGGNTLYLPVHITNPADVNVPVTAVIRKASGQWAFKVDVSFKIPVVIPGTEEPWIKDLTVGPLGAFKTVKGKKVSLFTLPKTCKGSWPFRWDTTFTDGSKSTATSSVRCKR